jgi:TolB protein
MRFLVVFFVLFCGLVMGQTNRFGAAIPFEPTALSNPTPLTKDGKSGGLRWSPDGRRMLLRSTADSACPQLYWFDPLTSERKLASTGKGGVRSGYPLKGGKTWFFDSTHEDTMATGCPPFNLGSVPAAFNIYSSTAKAATRLTNSPAFEGDLDVSPDDKRVVYSSASTGDLELWTMDLDGLNKKQLTRSPGYDGDPSFSADGRRIVFRANRARKADAVARIKPDLEEGRANLLPSEIFVMNSNGTDERQISSFGCVVLDPVFTPDGRRVVFAADLPACQGKSFDLFLVNIDGTGLMQLTRGNGFTSEPYFSPDGKKLAFTQNGNIVLADWTAPAPPAETINPLSKP